MRIRNARKVDLLKGTKTALRPLREIFVRAQFDSFAMKNLSQMERI